MKDTCMTLNEVFVTNSKFTCNVIWLKKEEQKIY